LVVLPAETPAEGIDAAVTAALEPFDENTEVPVYISKTRQELIDGERANLIRYRDEGRYAEWQADEASYEADMRNPNHLNYLKVEFPEKLTHLDDDEWLYKEATRWCEPFDAEYPELDEAGNRISTYNPKSKWDWWQIGGRWSGMLNQADREVKSWTGSDYLRKRDLHEPVTTFAFLDLDGEWHERGNMGWFGMVSDEKDDWEDTYANLLDKVPDDAWLVVVDVHI
jgi:hypothetical protein